MQLQLRYDYELKKIEGLKKEKVVVEETLVDVHQLLAAEETAADEDEADTEHHHPVTADRAPALPPEEVEPDTERSSLVYF